MIATLTVLIILTVLSLIIIISSINESVKLMKGGILILVITIVFGWCAIGLLVPLNTTYTTIPKENIVIIIDGDKVVTYNKISQEVKVFDDIFTYRTVKDGMSYNYVCKSDINLYGMSVENECFFQRISNSQDCKK